MNLPHRNTTSAGGIVPRERGSSVELLVVSKAKNVEPRWAPTLYQLPKGTVEPVESIEAAALREVREETGYEATIIRKAGIAQWSYERTGCLWHENVHYFLMNLASDVQHTRDEEFDAVWWLAASDAVTLISYPEEKRLLNQLSDVLGIGHDTFIDVLSADLQASYPCKNLPPP